MMRNRLIHTPVMKTEWRNHLVRLRPFEPSDVEALFEAATQSIPEVSPWLEWCHPGYSRAEAESWISTRPREWITGVDYSFAILDAQDNTFLGCCGLNQVNRQHRFANLGYWVRTSATRRGIAPAATLLLAQFGFRELQLQRIEIVVDVNNARSRRVAEKVNATFEGVERNRITTAGRSSDAMMFSLIPKDFGL